MRYDDRLLRDTADDEQPGDAFVVCDAGGGTVVSFCYR